MQQSGLPAAAVSADSEKLAGLDTKIDPAKRLDAPLIVTLLQASDLKDRTSHGAAPRLARDMPRAMPARLPPQIQRAQQCRLPQSRATAGRMLKRCSRFAAESPANEAPPSQRGS